MLQPEAPVQLKPDPAGKGPPKPKPKGEVDVLKGKVGALEEENAGLKDEVSGLRTENAERKRETDEVNAKVEAANAALVKRLEQDVARGIEDVHAQLRDADAAMGGFEALVERTLVSDDQLRAGDKAVDGAIETHKEAQKPGVLDGLSMILDVANLLKSGLTLMKIAASRSLTEGARRRSSGRRSTSRPTPTAPPRTQSTGPARRTLRLAGTRRSPWSPPSMPRSTSSQVACNRCWPTRSARRSTRSSRPSTGPRGRRNKVQDGVDNGYRFDLSFCQAQGTGKQTGEAVHMPVRDIDRRVSKLEKLLAARDPARGGGGELAKGSTGRSVFDLVAENPKACSLFAETTLRVSVKDEGDFDTSVERTGYWLSVADPDLRRRPGSAAVPASDSSVITTCGVGKDAWYLPMNIGQTLSTLITDTTELPYADVHLRGIVVKEHATREAWEDPKLRRACSPLRVSIRRWTARHWFHNRSA